MNISNSTFPEGLNSSREATERSFKRSYKSKFSDNNIDDPYDYGNILALIGNGYFIKLSSDMNKVLSLKIQVQNYDHMDQSCHMKDIIWIIWYDLYHVNHFKW